MKRSRLVALATLMLIALLPSFVFAAFDSGSTGEDGALEVTQNSQLQLPPDGVFNFTTVHVASGATLTFKKNDQNTPVTILASGDVKIEGTISVNGSNGNYIIPGEGGSGGFDGGVGGAAKQVGRRGEGPGGGYGGSPKVDNENFGGSGGGGGFTGMGGGGSTANSSAPGGAGGAAYGNERIIPLLGGSGGGGGGGTSRYVGGAGGGGGGALLIASNGSIAITGAIYANGGRGADGEGVWGYYGRHRNGGGGGGGAGGAIRLIGQTISGNGTIQASGGGGGIGSNTDYWNSPWYGGSGSKGRIRFEGSNVTRTVGTDPPLSMGYPYAVTPPDMPTLTIVSIAGVAVPALPRGDFGAPDVTLPYSAKNPITIVVQATNIPTGTQVTLKANPAVGGTASASATLSGTDTSSTASVNLNLSTAYPSVITAFVTYQLTAANFYINGERVDMVRVASTLEGRSEITYITESGKEIPAYM